MIRVGILGATGYTGVEMVRLCLGHPQVQITVVTSEKNALQPFSDVFGAFYGVFESVLEPLNVAAIAQKIDVAFLCLPHHSAMHTAAALLEKGVKVIDLSADFRLRSAQAYEQWYGKHDYPQLLEEAVYGLPELYRDKIKSAPLIANPGCYPTSAALALAPLVKENLVDLTSIIVDSKSGVSGAGRSAEIANLFCEVNEGFRAYKVATHRHMPEIEQTLSDLARQPVRISFTPHLVPMDRGILTTVYLTPRAPLPPKDLQAIYEAFYKKEGFVRVKPSGKFPNTKEVRGTNFCDIGVVADERTGRIIILSAIDNLTKGAAGQALQNLNVSMGWEESLGLGVLLPLS